MQKKSRTPTNSGSAPELAGIYFCNMINTRLQRDNTASVHSNTCTPPKRRRGWEGRKGTVNVLIDGPIGVHVFLAEFGVPDGVVVLQWIGHAVQCLDVLLTPLLLSRYRAEKKAAQVEKWATARTGGQVGEWGSDYQSYTGRQAIE